MKHYSYHIIDLEELSATDLRDAATDCAQQGHALSAARVTIYRRDRPEAEQADALYCATDAIGGVAWGADATWGDAPGIATLIRRWRAGTLA